MAVESPRKPGKRVSVFNADTRAIFSVQSMRLGEWLVRRSVIDRHQLFVALGVALRHHCRLGDAVVWLQFAARDVVEEEAWLLRDTEVGGGATGVNPTTAC